MDVSSSNYHHPRPWDTPIESTTMPALLARAVAAHPDRTLIDFLGRKLSYQAMHAEARRFAAGLQAAGIGRGDRVGLFLPNVPIYLSAYYGAMMAGATVVNFSPLYSVEELAHQVEDSGTRLLVTVDAKQLFDTAAAVLDQSSLQTLVVGELAAMLPALKSLGLKLFKRSAIASPSYGESVVAWSDMLPRAEPRRLDIAPDEIALLQYTGGTTGRPKGAMLSHANLAANAQQVNAIDPFDRSDPDIIMGALPLFHVFANTCVLNRSVVRGATIAMVPRFEAGDVLALMAHLGIDKAAFLGTSRGGLISMVIAATQADRVLGVCLNDVGPVVDREGLKVIDGYIGRKPKAATLNEMATIRAQTVNGFEDVPASRWREEAERSYIETDDGLDIRYDPALRESFLAAMNAEMPDLWPLFMALAAKPLAVIRGAGSDVLTAGTAEEMRNRIPEMRYAEVPGRGHAPFLDEPEAVETINAWLDDCR